LFAGLFMARVTIRRTYSYRRGEPVAELYCSCEQRHKIWGEFWWVGGEYRWIFFDDSNTSETYAEQVTHCPACGRPLERKNLRVLSSAN
jgi:hypothetical protein